MLRQAKCSSTFHLSFWRMKSKFLKIVIKKENLLYICYHLVAWINIKSDSWLVLWPKPYYVKFQLLVECLMSPHKLKFGLNCHIMPSKDKKMLVNRFPKAEDPWPKVVSHMVVDYLKSIYTAALLSTCFSVWVMTLGTWLCLLFLNKDSDLNLCCFSKVGLHPPFSFSYQVHHFFSYWQKSVLHLVLVLALNLKWVCFKQFNSKFFYNIFENKLEA